MAERSGRNDLCPCGSGKKYKRCCLGNDPPKPLPTKAPSRAVPSTSKNRPFPAMSSFKPPPEPPSRPRDEWDDWYDRYRAVDPAAKVNMLRTLLAESRPPEFYKDLEFVSLVLDLQRDLSPNGEETSLSFFEEMLASHPDVFNLGAEWFARRMAYAYVRSGRERDIARVLPCLLDEAHKTDDPFFDLIDLVHLADLREESRTLTFAAIKQSAHTQLTPWAIDDLVELAVFFLYHEVIEAGRTAEAMAELRKQLPEIDCNPSDEHLTAMLAHRAGVADRSLERKDLLGRDEPAGFNLYLLSLDFGRWLTVERRLSPLVADTMRHFVNVCLVEMREESDCDPLVLHQQRLDKYLAQLLGLMSVMYSRGVATLIGMRHFRDFLAAVNLVGEGEHRRAKRICDDLWSQMHRALGDTVPDYAFLNKYLCGPFT